MEISLCEHVCCNIRRAFTKNLMSTSAIQECDCQCQLILWAWPSTCFPFRRVTAFRVGIAQLPLINCTRAPDFPLFTKTFHLRRRLLISKAAESNSTKAVFVGWRKYFCPPFSHHLINRLIQRALRPLVFKIQWTRKF